MTGTLLIVGSAGFIGRHVAACWRADRRPLITASHRPGADLFIDLRGDPGMIAHSLRPGVTHALVCSGITSIDQCFHDTVTTHAFNVTNAMDWMRLLLDRDIHVIFCSSDFVFRGDRGGYREDDALDPVTEYGRQKAAVETALAGAGKPHSILRMGKLYGLDPDPGSFLHSVLADTMAGGPVRAATDQIIAPSRVDDVARTVAAIIDRHLDGIFHIAPIKTCTRYDLACLLAGLIGTRGSVQAAEIDDFGFAEPRPKRCWLDGRASAMRTGLQFTELSEVIGPIVELWRGLDTSQRSGT